MLSLFSPGEALAYVAHKAGLIGDIWFALVTGSDAAKFSAQWENSRGLEIASVGIDDPYDPAPNYDDPYSFPQAAGPASSDDLVPQSERMSPLGGSSLLRDPNLLAGNGMFRDLAQIGAPASGGEPIVEVRVPGVRPDRGASPIVGWEYETVAEGLMIPVPTYGPPRPPRAVRKTPAAASDPDVVISGHRPERALPDWRNEPDSPMPELFSPGQFDPQAFDRVSTKTRRRAPLVPGLGTDTVTDGQPNTDIGRPENSYTAREETVRSLPQQDWTTQTEWRMPTTAYSPFKMITEVDTGNPTANILVNKIILPWANLLAAVVNTPFEAMGQLDDAMRRTRFAPEWDALQTMGPMMPAMGIALRAPFAIEYASAATVKAGQILRRAALAPMWWFLGAGGPGGGPLMTSSIKLPAAQRAAIQLNRNAFKQIVGVERTSVEILQRYPGSVSLGRELHFDAILSYDRTTLLIVDELFKTPSGKLISAESKFGRFAGFTSNQRTAGVPTQTRLLAVPRPATVARTSLLREPVLIEVEVFQWEWPDVP